MKQTPVEWLIKEFNLENFEATTRFAKEMERSTIIKAFNDGETNVLDKYKHGDNFDFELKDGTDYFCNKYNK